MPENCCGFVSPFDGYQCDAPVFEGAEDGLCIGHTFDLKKSKKALQRHLIQKIKNKDYNFDGFVFPFQLAINKFKFDAPVSFIGCTFQKGLRFSDVNFDCDQVRFDQCWFESKNVVFEKCVFQSPKIAFNDSALTADRFEFRCCEFLGERLEFERAQWRANKKIAFLSCVFGAQFTGFENAIIKAPLISFSGSTFNGQNVNFYRTQFHGKKLTFKRIKSIKGKVSFTETPIHSEEVDFSESKWLDKGLRWNKVNWSGASLSFSKLHSIGASLQIKRSRFKGASIDWSSMDVSKGAFECIDSKFNMNKSFTLDGASVNGRFLFNGNKVNSPLISFAGFHAANSDFCMQQTSFRGHSFLFTKAVIGSQRATMTRTRINAEDVRFDHARFENLQTSFQAMQIDAERILFTSTVLSSKRTAFNRAVFGARQTYFDNANFGSGITTFWKTDFGGGAQFNGAKDRGGVVHFNTDLAKVHWEGTELTRCRFHDSSWTKTGWMKRPCSADEFSLLKRGNYRQLVNIYNWISKQYSDSSQDSIRRDFLYAAREIERWNLIHQRSLPPLIRMEFLRWMTGYGLGISRVGIVRGLGFLTASLIPLFVKLR